MLRTALPCAVVLLSTLAHAQSVLIVDDDGGPGVDYLDLQPAIDAAAPGSILVVRPGQYLPFVLDGKGLSILGEDVEQVVVQLAATGPGCRVTNTPAGERVLLSGFTVRNDPAGAVDSFLAVDNTSGLVWLQGLDLEYLFQVISLFGFASTQPEALAVTDASRVVLSGCRVLAMPGSNEGEGPELGADGMVVMNSVVDLFDTTLTGGAPTFGGGTGNDGLRLENSTATIHGGVIQGGTGGPAEPLVGAVEGQGGTGLVVDATSTARVLGGILTGGFGGGGPFTPGPAGPAASLAPGATLVEVDVPTSFLAAPTLVPDDVPLKATVAGEPGATGVLFANLAPQPLYLGALPGTSALGSNLIFLDTVVLNTLGLGLVDYGLVPPPAGFESLAIGVQAAVIDSLGALSLTDPGLITVVRAASL